MRDRFTNMTEETPIFRRDDTDLKIIMKMLEIHHDLLLHLSHRDHSFLTQKDVGERNENR